MALGEGSYQVLIGPGLLQEIPELLLRYAPASRYAVISDSIVAPLYGQRVAAALEKYAPAVLVTFPSGEWNKTRETWADLTDRLLQAGLGRDGAVVAVGGGVVGDLAGFTAATYMRGIPYVQVPTTLLAMLDSSVGGKTGVDTPRAKNAVGAFHQPRLVVADTTTLKSLPEAQLAAGMAEAIKHGAIADARYFEHILQWRDEVFAKDPQVLAEIVRRSVEIKSAIVASDEREAGPRSALNFGHTIAHALETAMGYELLHGEAVAIGMAVEAGLGEQMGISLPGTRSAILEALRSYRLPHDIPPGTDLNRLIETMNRDKKARSNTVRFALLERIGAVARDPDGSWTIAVDHGLLLSALERGS
ncbi:3-dehydroquinate synthase [bacterium HR33]|nr:3-dehydroquinate synthase [bacterium HR33]